MNNKKMRKLRREKGITLLALVITMVILVILATVTISAAIGDNGLIKKADETKDMATNSLAGESEKVNQLVQEYANMMSEDGEIPPPEEDKIPPTVQILTGEVTENSIAVTVNATDTGSGLATSGIYKYYLNGEEKITSERNTYTFTGLPAGTEYTIKVEAFDKAGNKGKNSTKGSTKESPNSVKNKLKEGDYVNYVDGTSTPRTCVVLYGPENANYSNYGIQIIPMKCVEDVTFGEEGQNDAGKFNRNRDVYNNVIVTLNNATQKYLNPTFAESVRCVGSVPDNPSYDGAGMFTRSESWFSKYNGTFKDKDENYKIDYNQMQAVNKIHNIDQYYWLNSRSVINWEENSYFSIVAVNQFGSPLGTGIGVTMSRVDSDGSTYTIKSTYGLRPVFTLKSEIKVTGGDGTPGNPYNLGV